MNSLILDQYVDIISTKSLCSDSLQPLGKWFNDIISVMAVQYLYLILAKQFT